MGLNNRHFKNCSRYRVLCHTWLERKDKGVLMGEAAEVRAV